MSKSFSSLGEALEAIVRFRDERDWGQYHVPRHLVDALSIEASELQEEFLWKEEEEVSEYLQSPEGKGRVRDEIADVLIYALLLCESIGVNPLDAIRDKLGKNAEKYPVDNDEL